MVKNMSRSIVTRHNKNGVIIKLWGGGSDKKDKQKLIDRLGVYQKWMPKDLN